ncbi:MAG: hypothetical protein DHS20C16_28620 [Phycisphaerae bacterium]|nr:MAG: hypothetical protein DHS20C16_28620 [Phycisphaerae bacterium]
MAVGFSAGLVHAQAVGDKSEDLVWSNANAALIEDDLAKAWVRPPAYQAVTLDRRHLKTVIDAAPLESEISVRDAQSIIELPMPDGSFTRFQFVESPVMAPELAARYPEIRTYYGQGIDDPHATVRFDSTPAGFHAQILSPNGAVYIDPINRGDVRNYASYFKRDMPRPDALKKCQLVPNPNAQPVGDSTSAESGAERAGETLRTYRLACATTFEYTQFHGGTVSSGLAAVVTAINRVTGVYEVDVAVRLELVANNDLLIYTTSSDPYSNNDGFSMLSQNQSNVNSVIGSANYDVGHVFSTGGGGVASLGVICSGSKAQGVTGQPSPINDPFYIDYVAHEMGHQFGANHSFNGVTSNCSGGNRNGSTAYEPGSGSTIMAYAGICGGDNLQSNSDPYFHHDSIREIRNHITGGSGNNCPVTTATGNNDPSVQAGSNYTIPQSTPFELTASGSDPDLDSITYCWEERDLGPGQALSASDNGSSPLFRSFNPSANPTRTFPRLNELVNNTTAPGERLPTTNRTMDFRCTVRDNLAGGGGVGFDDMTVTVTTGAGPFEVTSPNGGEVWSGVATVEWDVAGTDSSPVSAANVDILLSTDGGFTYPIVLVSNTPNDGVESVIVPNAPTSTARVKVKGNGNVFFDISNANFTVDTPGALAITFPSGAPSEIAPGVTTNIDVRVIPLGENVVPGTPTLHHRSNIFVPFQTVALNHVGGEFYEAPLPPFSCSDTARFYISAQGDGGTTVALPVDAPSSVMTAVVGQDQQIFADSFESDLGWTTSGDASEGLWELGTPLDNDRGDPPSDSDGSGQCYLTENDPSDTNSDVDNGTATLTSPVFDLSGGGTISYAYWLNDISTGPLGSEDSMEVDYATNAAGTNWTAIRTYTSASSSWRNDSIEVGVETASSSTFRIRFSVSDETPGDVVEGGIDAFDISAFVCINVGDGDFDNDGDVDLADFAEFQSCWGASGTLGVCTAGDLNGDSTVGADDIEQFVTQLAGPTP